MKELKIILVVFLFSPLLYAQVTDESSGILQVTGLYLRNNKTIYDFINMEASFPVKPRLFVTGGMSFVSYRYGKPASSAVHFYSIGLGIKYKMLETKKWMSFATFGLVYQTINFGEAKLFSNGVGPFINVDFNYRISNKILLGLKSQLGVSFGAQNNPGIFVPEDDKTTFGIIAMLSSGLSLGYIF